MACPSDWKLYRSFCYSPIFPVVTWPEAQAACQKENANLASVHDDGVYKFLLSMQNDYNLINGGVGGLWIGGSQKGKGPFTWVDGSCSDFTAWRKDEARGNDEDECIVQWKDGKGWNDRPCTLKMFYVCQKATVTGSIPLT